MNVELRPMRRGEAVEVAAWRYDPRYSFYDWTADAFERIREFDHETNGGVFRFLEMARPVA
jgi:hypothetical protein